MKTLCYILVSAPLLLAANIDLVTVPKRDKVQMTIYNSADLTLVRDSRALTLRKGANRLQFSWANTLIDPTSLEMLPLANADRITVLDIAYPPRVRNLGLWNIRSELSGRCPFEISYFTSGISWRAFYMGTLSADEKTMRLQGYVRVTNNSGEDYEDAETRLIVGKVNILEQIAALAQRQHAFGRPGQFIGGGKRRNGSDDDLAYRKHGQNFKREESRLKDKEIIKEGLSEYFLYTIEGTETIPHGWSKRLPSFDVGSVPVVNLYKYEEERWGRRPVRFLSFKNDEAHQLGDTPIPGGLLKVYRGTADQHLSYAGQSSFKYIPVGEDVENNLGAVSDIIVKPKLMQLRQDQFLFDRHGNIAGWDEIRDWEVEVKNTRDLPVRVEIRRNFPDQHWTLKRGGDIDAYEKVDVDTVKFVVDLKPRSGKTFSYTHRAFQGSRRER